MFFFFRYTVVAPGTEDFKLQFTGYTQRANDETCSCTTKINETQKHSGLDVGYLWFSHAPRILLKELGHPVSTKSGGRSFQRRTTEGKNEWWRIFVFADGRVSFELCPLVCRVLRLIYSGSFMMLCSE